MPFSVQIGPVFSLFLFSVYRRWSNSPLSPRWSVGPSVCSPVRRRPLAFGCSRLLATRSGAPSLWAPSPPRVADQSYSWLRLVFEPLVPFIRPSVIGHSSHWVRRSSPGRRMTAPLPSGIGSSGIITWSGSEVRSIEEDIVLVYHPPCDENSTCSN